MFFFFFLVIWINQLCLHSYQALPNASNTFSINSDEYSALVKIDSIHLSDIVLTTTVTQPQSNPPSDSPYHNTSASTPSQYHSIALSDGGSLKAPPSNYSAIRPNASLANSNYVNPDTQSQPIASVYTDLPQ